MELPAGYLSSVDVPNWLSKCYSLGRATPMHTNHPGSIVSRVAIYVNEMLGDFSSMRSHLFLSLPAKAFVELGKHSIEEILK